MVKLCTFDSPPLLEVYFPLVNSKNWYKILVLTKRSFTTWRKDLEMEVYKIGKIIENQEIEIHLILHSLEEAREELRKSLKRRKDIAIVENDTQYKEIDTTKLFENGDSKEFDASIVDLMEKNKEQVEEIRNLKIEQQSQAMILCEVIE